MKIRFALFILALMMPSVVHADAGDFAPDEARVTPYCGVYHFDRNKTRGGRSLNETPSCLGGSLGWHMSDTVEAGATVLSFRNSIHKRTVIAGGYIEKDLYQNPAKNGVLDACGLGLTGGVQVVKGYDAPVVGDVYGYCEKWKLRTNMAVIPPLGADIDSAVIWSVELKVWEG